MSQLFIFIVFILAIVFYFIRRVSQSSIEEVIHEYIIAIGGIDRLRSIKAIHSYGTFLQNDRIVKFEETKSSGNFWRINYEEGGRNSFVLFQKDQLPSYLFEDSQPPLFINILLANISQPHLGISDSLVDYKKKGFTAYLTGVEKVDEAKCYRILLKPLEGNNWLYFINRQNFLLVEKRMLATGDERHTGNEVLFIIKYSEYKRAKGLLFSHKEEWIMAETICTIIYDKIE